MISLRISSDFNTGVVLYVTVSVCCQRFVRCARTASLSETVTALSTCCWPYRIWTTISYSIPLELTGQCVIPSVG